ncbi:MAG: TAT-variant-translocated molybdopterin oxidoreductase [Bacteroidetes Order II. Incertae sedis bacterium]|nr:TAT-variant-translocated molybdopterin oxidoreductase [Bacteroidetes Order II. bacterium]
MFLELDILDSSEKDEVSNPDLSVEKPKRTFWRSMEHLESSPQYKEFVKSEFKAGALDTADMVPGSRRRFLQLMGASAAMMGLAACRKPFEKVLPYTRQPEQIIPGRPLMYATAMPFGDHVRPVLVESHEGRPTKVEGNPDHPQSKGVGATSPFEQASILNMFDPERIRLPKFKGQSSNWNKFQQEVVSDLAGKRVAVLAPSLASPTLAALLATARNNGWTSYTYDAAGDDVEALGYQMAFGRALRPVYQFSQAKVIVSLDADFLAATDKNMVHNAREFAAGRRVMSPNDEMSRLYVVESAYTTTGGMADNRLKLRSSEVPAFAAALAAATGVVAAAPKATAFANHQWVKEIASDLRRNAGKAVVVAGANQPPVVHALAAAINSTLGAFGTTVTLYDHPAGSTLVPQMNQLGALTAAMKAGQVDVLLMLGVNPVYNAPSDLDFTAALKKVPVSVHAGHLMDESGQAATWHLPLSYYLEAWGDGLSYTGVRSIIQPLIAPLWDSKSDIELVNWMSTGTQKSGFDLVKAANSTVNWEKTLHDGFVEGTGFVASTVGVANIPAEALNTINTVDKNTIEVVFKPHLGLYDGAFSNNAWMQELPEHITKIVWDNVAVMSPSTAQRLGLSVVNKSGNHYVDTISLKVNDRSISIPVWMVPGFVDNSISVSLGYGRQIKSDNEMWSHDFFSKEVGIYQNGPVCNGIGVSVEKLRTSQAMQIGLHAEVAKTGETYQIVTTQDHGALPEDWESQGAVQHQQNRRIVRMQSLEEYKKKPRFAKDYEHKVDGKEVNWSQYPSLWEDERADIQEHVSTSPWYQYQWGMVIDLNTCTGCSACITACQSENNIPVVGKEQVSMGRDMYWMRLDRYFYGEQEDPGMVIQPMLCHHCENAPCEQVCPINATSHSPDGLNEMTYNRCVGTRYCANNCPYKVRRYNFLNWTKDLPATVQMTNNPNVTVRFRGVMEKCTFCVQRIREAGLDARREQKNLKEGDFLTACQQVCPSQAITFGNIRDKNSAVAKMKKHDRNYEVLADLANRPRVSYFARITNPNTALKGPEYRDGVHHHEEHTEHA